MSIRPDDIEVLFHDDALVVVNKPEGVLTHRGWGRDKVTMLDLVRDMVGCYVYPVHRLDRATSGVLLLGKGKEVARDLNKLFEERKVEKRYLALVKGEAPDAGIADRPLSPDPQGKGRPRRDPVPAFTMFRKLLQLEFVSLVEAMPLTGRVHQIRRHLYHLGHAIAGDKKYGFRALNRIYKKEHGLERMALHAWKMSFVHPLTEERIVCESLPPRELLEPMADIGIQQDFWETLSQNWTEWEGWKEEADKVREQESDN